jgi:hypothetical protein
LLRRNATPAPESALDNKSFVAEAPSAPSADFWAVDPEISASPEFQANPFSRPGDTIPDPETTFSNADDFWDAKPDFAGRTGRPWLGIVLTSLIFASVHAAQWPAPLALFPLAVVIGTVYYRTGSLIAAVCMHAMFNGISTLMLFIAVLSGHKLEVDQVMTRVRAERSDRVATTSRGAIQFTFAYLNR